MNHGKTKHIALKVQFVCNLVENWLLELNYLLTDRMRQRHLQQHWKGSKYHFFVVSSSEQTLHMVAGVFKI